MGPLGGQEMLLICLLVLLFFGPKELPKIARTIGKAMTEFRRAQNELKTTLSREMENLERDTGVRELTATNYLADTYNYDQYDGSSYYEDGTDPYPTTYETSASAIEGAELMAGPLQIEAAADSVPHGHVHDAGSSPVSHSDSAVHAESAAAAPSIHNEADHAATGNPVHG
jgi:sec-independent protein translocase protein TatA